MSARELVTFGSADCSAKLPRARSCRKVSESEPGDVCGPEWQEYAANSNSLSKVCETQDCCAWVPQYQKFMPLFTDLHIMDQSHCVFDSEGRTMVDFIGASETLDEDWATVLNEINRRMGTKFEAAQLQAANTRMAHTGEGPKITEAKKECSMGKYPHLDAVSTRNIGLQYSMDAVKFGYLPLEVA
jgi:Sulfotransferase family